MADVSRMELVRLLNRLRDCAFRIRFRLSGRDWQTGFSNILTGHHPGMAYAYNGTNFSFITIADVVAFELEQPFEGFDAGIQYEVSD